MSMESNKGVEFNKYFKEQGNITGFSLSLSWYNKWLKSNIYKICREISLWSWNEYMIQIILIKNLEEYLRKEVIISVRE